MKSGKNNSNDNNRHKIERTARVSVIKITLTKKENKYYKDIGINLNQHPDYVIRNNKAEYLVKEYERNSQRKKNNQDNKVVRKEINKL